MRIRKRRKPRPQPRADSSAEIPVYDKPPDQRTPKEIRDAIEADAVLERRGATDR